jgi:hypothetical protein
MKLPTELREALEPSEAELERLTAPLPEGLRVACASATQPTPAELARLQPRGRRAGLPLTPFLLATALAVLVTLGAWPSGTTRLAEGIEMAGSASVAVAPGALTVVEQQDGLVTYEVEPQGPSDLLVRAGEVEVLVTGTRFSVLREGRHVEVEVYRGSVEVSADGATTRLEQGGLWRRPRIEASSAAPARLQATRSEASSPSTASELHPYLERSRPQATTTIEESEELPPEGADLDAFHALVKARESGGLKLAQVEAFLEAHPDSDFAGEARVFRLEALARGEDAQLALREIEAWLGEHASGSRFVQVHYLRATLLRDRFKDCDAARPSYLVVAELGRGKMAAEAQRYLEACAP